MRKLFGMLILLVCGFSSPAFAQRYTLFPEFFSGSAPAGRWVCEMFFTNQDIFLVEGIEIDFYDFDGIPVSVDSNLGNATGYTFNLAAGATQEIQVNPEAPFVEGYAVILYPANGSPVRATVVYRLEDGENVAAEFGVPQQEYGCHYSFPVKMNSSQGISTAVAVAYPGIFGSNPQDVIFNLIGSDGEIDATAIVTLNPGEHFADYLFESTLFQAFFPDINNLDYIGSVSVSSPFGVGVMAIRQDKNAFGAISTDGGPVLGPFGPFSPFASGDWVSDNDVEPNDNYAQAQTIAGSTMINGFIDPELDLEPDKDYFKFTGQAGDILSVICDAYLADSWLDSVLEVSDGTSAIAINDQNGLSPELFPSSDSFIQVKLPADGTYYIILSDYFNDGGPEYSYTLYVKITSDD
jgi:hypothetical protein